MFVLLSIVVCLLVDWSLAQYVTCLNCTTTGFGLRGTQKWCQCCGQNCGGNLNACKTNDGFCTTRCLSTDGGLWCSANASLLTQTTGATTTTTTTTATTKLSTTTTTTLVGTPTTTSTTRTPMPTPTIATTPIASSTTTPTTISLTTAAPVTSIDCARDCPNNIFGIKGSRRWCICCAGNCGGFQSGCITNDKFCLMPGGLCLAEGVCGQNLSMVTTSSSTSSTSTTTLTSLTPTPTTSLTSESTSSSSSSSSSTLTSESTSSMTTESTTTTATMSLDVGPSSTPSTMLTTNGGTGLTTNAMTCEGANCPEALCWSAVIVETDWERARTTVGIIGIISAALSLIVFIAGIVIGRLHEINQSWPFIALAAVPLGVGLLLSVVVDARELNCLVDNAASSVCRAQGSLVYFGALSTSIWLFITVIQALRVAITLNNSTASSSDAAKNAIQDATPSLIVKLITHSIGWGVPLLGMIFALVTNRMRYPIDEYGLWCFVDDNDQGTLWPWALFFGPTAVLAVFLLVGVAFASIRERRSPKHRRHAFVQWLTAVGVIVALLYLLWAVARLAIDAQSDRVQRRDVLISRSLCREVGGNREQCEESDETTVIMPLWFAGGIAASLIGSFTPLLLIGALISRRSSKKDDGLGMDASHVVGDESIRDKKTKITRKMTATKETDIYQKDDLSSTSESLSIRILGDEDKKNSEVRAPAVALRAAPPEPSDDGGGVIDRDDNAGNDAAASEGQPVVIRADDLSSSSSKQNSRSRSLSQSGSRSGSSSISLSNSPSRSRSNSGSQSSSSSLNLSSTSSRED